LTTKQLPENNYWVRSGSYVFLQRISIFIFGFGSYFFLVRYFPQEEFGVWALFIVITSIVEMSRSAFIQNAFVKFYSQANVDKGKLSMASLFLNFTSNLFFIAVMLLLIPVLKNFWNSPEIGKLIVWYSITSTILVPLTQLNYLEQASHSFKGIFWSAVTRQGLFFGFVLFTFLFVPNLSLIIFAAIQSFCALAGLVVAWKLSSRFIFEMPSVSKIKIDWQVVRELFKFGKYILGTGITSSIGKSTDQVVLGSLSHSTVALYNAAIRVMNFIEIPTYSISNVVYPKIAEKVNNEGKTAAAELYEKSVAYMVAIILPVIIVILIFPETVLWITAGKNYMEAAPVLRMIAATAILFPFNVQVGTVFEVIGKPHVSFGMNSGANILNLSLNVFLIFKFGIIGAALATIFTAIALFIVSQIWLFNELRVNIFRIIGQIPGAYLVLYREFINKIRNI
jgi:O-antigen/teichoic acid export membrane protein